MRSTKNKYVTVIDIGSSKISGLVARVDFSQSALQKNTSLIAAHSVPANGIVSGAVDNVQDVEIQISSLIETLEEKSNQRIDSVWINASTGAPKTSYEEIEKQINGYVSADDIADLQNELIDRLHDQDKYILHALPVGFEVNGSFVKNPVGMKADLLKAQMVLITGKLSQLRNLGVSIERAQVEILGRVTTPIASALGCLDQSEKQNGVICIDIGAETISICVVNKNVPVYVDVLKMGSNYITKDIARAFGISYENAEIIKKNHGTSISSMSDEKETLELPIIGADYDISGFENRPKSHLTQIIQPRCEEMLEHVYNHLKRLGILHPAYHFVMTGGGSALKGIEHTAANIFGMRPRIACPNFLGTLPQNISGTEYASLVGVLHYAFGELNELPTHRLFSKLRRQKGFTGKILNWLVQNF